MMSIFPVLFLLLVQLGYAVYSLEVYKTCLSCPRVSHPYECTTFSEVWPHERCSIDLLLLMNGSTAYRFGYETATNCVHSDSVALEQQRRMTSADISLCHECCGESLCNRKLCGIPESNSTNVACLIGNEVSGSPLDTSITYCDKGERCYVERLPHHGIARPNQPNYGNYGCASQAVCEHLASGAGAGSSALCRKCCAQDGCNRHICQSQVQSPPGTTVSAASTAPGSTRSTVSSVGVTQVSTRFTDCWGLYNRGGFHQDGVYDIYPPPAYSRLRVRCDMTTDGGGWVVIQRRYDGSLDFTRTFQEYKEGFGSISGEYWLGLQWMYVLSSQGDTSVQLRVDLCAFNGDVGYAKFNEFSIAGQNGTYYLVIGTNVAGNLNTRYLSRNHNGREFQAAGGAAQLYKGGWWYNSNNGYNINLNGGRYNGGEYQGIAWYRFGGGYMTSLRSSEMKIRAVNVTGYTSGNYTCGP